MAAHLDDQQELENFKYFWRSKGRWLFAVLLLASLVYLGWVLYQGHIKTKNEEAATALAGLVEKAKASQDKQTLQADLSILQQKLSRKHLFRAGNHDGGCRPVRPRTV